MNNPLPTVADDVIRQRVTSGSFQRGRAYADEGAVVDFSWDGATLTSTVAGSVPAPYRCRISLVQVGTMWIPMVMGCSCPVRTGCKHAVATLLVARDGARQPEAKPDWRNLLGQIAPMNDEPSPLAIGFYLRPNPGPSQWQNRLQPVLSELEAYEQGRRLNLLVRPMVRGKSGAWIKGGLTWRGLSHELAHDGQHVMVLRQLLGLYDSTRTNAGGGVDYDGLILSDVGGSMLWEILRHAQSIGVELVPGKDMTLELCDEAEVWVGADRQQEDLALRPQASIGGEAISGEWFPIGDHGIYSYEHQGNEFRVRLAPTSQPLPPLIANLSEPIVIPQAEEEEFFDAFYPSLRNRIPVEPTPEVTLPVYKPARARLSGEFLEHDRITFEWSFEYYGPRGSYPLVPATPPHVAHRDLPWEEQMVRQIEHAWPEYAMEGELHGAQAARFVAETLPQLEQVDGVEVQIQGSPPAYTLLEGHPHIKITTVESQHRDWFDLGFEITINGYLIPYTDIFAALTKGQDSLLLVDKTYLSLEHEAFDALRELLQRAAQIPEWEPEQPQISRYQVDFWEEFEDLADETVEATSWRSSIQGLRNLGNIEQIATPAELQAELRPYQQEGFQWLAFLHEHDLGGILADDMGLGKTLQTLALITHAQPTATAPFLIVAPTSVLSTWQSEAAKFAPHLRVEAVRQTSKKRRHPLPTKGVDIVVTSYAIARLDAQDFQAHTWAGLVLDEAQFVKNPRTRLHREILKISANFRLAITGTPMENSLTDLWSLMKITAPGLFPSARDFRENFVRPIENNNDADRLADLRRLIRPFMLRRTKELVAPELPPKQEQLLEVELSGVHRKLYDETLQRERQKVLRLIDDFDENRWIVFRSLNLLRMLALSPALISEEHAQTESAKLTTLTAHIAELAAEGHRVLVFSQFTSFLALAANACAAVGLDYEYLDGSTTNRGAVIDAFREGDAPVFFISLKAGGFGVTLTEADYVFVLDPWWNPAAESQAVDRTHRIGQTKNVIVYRMVARETIEEKVMALQEKKAALFNAVVDDDAHFSKALTADDVRGLFG